MFKTKFPGHSTIYNLGGTKIFGSLLLNVPLWLRAWDQCAFLQLSLIGTLSNVHQSSMLLPSFLIFI